MERKALVSGSAIILLITAIVASGLLVQPWMMSIAKATLSVSNDELNVRGVGEVSIDPDRVKLYLSIIREAKTAKEATEGCANVFSALIQKLAEAGISRDQVETVSYTIQPVYSYPPHQRPVLEGYQATHRIVVMVISEEMEELGKKAGLIIDLAIDTGVDRVSHVQFTVSDDVIEKLRNEALKKAAQNARAKAESLAEALGFDLISVKRVSEWIYTPLPRPMPPTYALKGDAGAETELIPGVFKVQASIEVTYRIGP